MSSLMSFINESFPPRSTFHIQDIPDLTNQVILVTGGSSGIGKETTRVLLSNGAKVYIAARNQTQSEETIRELKEETGNEAIFLSLNLANLKSVKAAAEAFLRKENRLHVLYNNAGIMSPPVERLTDDGYDLQFGTNVIGHFYLQQLLLPTMIQTAKTTSDGKVRVITTSSSGHLIGRLDFNTFKDSAERRALSAYNLYAQSKFGNVVVALELARRYGDHGIVSTSLNPGNIDSNIQRHLPSFVQQILRYLLFNDVAHGALTQLYAGTMPEAAALNGKYLIPWARVGAALETTQDREVGKALWEWLEEQVKDV